MGNNPEPTGSSCLGSLGSFANKNYYLPTPPDIFLICFPDRQNPKTHKLSLYSPNQGTKWPNDKTPLFPREVYATLPYRQVALSSRTRRHRRARRHLCPCRWRRRSAPARGRRHRRWPRPVGHHCRSHAIQGDVGVDDAHFSLYLRAHNVGAFAFRVVVDITLES
jgi:hypothetical protein